MQKGQRISWTQSLKIILFFNSPIQKAKKLINIVVTIKGSKMNLKCNFQIVKLCQLGPLENKRYA